MLVQLFSTTLISYQQSEIFAV